MPRFKNRKQGIKQAMQEVIAKEQEKIKELEQKTQETPETKEEKPLENQDVNKQTVKSEEFSFVIPAEKVPVNLKETISGDEVSLNITGNVVSNDETGVVLNIKTLEVI